MKKIIPFLILACMACDDEPDTNISGEWILQELPQTQFRRNRLDNSIPAFDVVFRIDGKQLTYVDLLLNDVEVEETATFNHHGETADITIEADGFSLMMTGCRRANDVILAGDVTYTLPNGETKIYKGISIARYLE